MDSDIINEKANDMYKGVACDETMRMHIFKIWNERL